MIGLHNVRTLLVSATVHHALVALEALVRLVGEAPGVVFVPDKGEQQPLVALVEVLASAVKRSIGSTTGCTITEKAPTRAFSWLKAPTSAFTFKTLLRHYAKRALTPVSQREIGSATQLSYEL